jgi:hypothetical protein
MSLLLQKKPPHIKLEINWSISFSSTFGSLIADRLGPLEFIILDSCRYGHV